MNLKGVKLTEKQLIFCKEYLTCFNIQQAAITAGYSPHTAMQSGYKLVVNPKIANYLSEITRKKAEKFELSIELVIRQLMNMAFFDPAEIMDTNGDILPVKQWPLACRQVVQGYDVEIIKEVRRSRKPSAVDKAVNNERPAVGKPEPGNGQPEHQDIVIQTAVKKVRFPDRSKNIENLGRYLQMFVDRVKHEVDTAEVIHYYVPVFNDSSSRTEIAEPEAVETVHKQLKQLTAGNDVVTAKSNGRKEEAGG